MTFLDYFKRLLHFIDPRCTKENIATMVRKLQIAEARFKVVQDVEPHPNVISHHFSITQRLIGDLYHVFIRVLPYFLDIFTPLPSSRKGNSHKKYASWKGSILQLVLTLWTLVFFLPTIIFGALFTIVVMLAYATVKPLLALQGTSRITVPRAQGNETNTSSYSKESWLFINGICTSQTGVKLTLHRLDELFHRKVIGLHNRTLGPFLDLLDCIFQRDLNYLNSGSFDAYAEVRWRVMHQSFEKVVLICHSQGAIIASLIVDQLLQEVDTKLIKQKLEVYTFGSAANHFSNPIVTQEDGSKGPLLKHVEHYANGKDPICRIGVLSYTEEFNKPKKLIQKKHLINPYYTRHRFSGRLFVREETKGHMLLSH